MAEKIAEAFVKLFADDEALKASLAKVPTAARQAGTLAASHFADAWGDVMAPQKAQRLEGFVEQYGAATSAFRPPATPAESPEGRQAKQTKQAVDDATRATKDYALSARDARGVASQFGVALLNEVNPAIAQGAAGALEAAVNLKDMGTGAAATGAGLAILATAMTLYVARVREANEAELALSAARRRGDYAAVQQQVLASVDALGRYEDQARLATQEITGLQSATSVLVAYWSNVFGPSVDEINERLQKQRQAANDLFKAFELPKMQAQARAEQADLDARTIENQQAMIETADELAASTDRLVAARKRQSDAQKALIENEAALLKLRLQRGEITQFQYDEMLADVRRRAANVTREFAIAEDQLRRASDQRQAQLRAGLIEHEERLAKARRESAQAVRGAVGQIATMEVQRAGSIQEEFELRRRLGREQTAEAIANVRAEADARRQVLQAQMQGATGEERARLERELTAVTAEENTKRTQIAANAAVEQHRLAEEQRRAQVAQAEQLFQVQQNLGQRGLRDDLERFTAVAEAARNGSRVQLDALGKVAALQKQLRDQAVGLVQGALGIHAGEFSRLGLEAPEFVDKEQVEQSLADARARAKETKEAFERGESVRRSDLEASLQQQQFFETFKQAGGDFAQVFQDAITPVAEAFQQQVGERLTEQLQRMTEEAQAGFTDLVAGVTQTWEQIEQVVGASVDRMVAKIESGQAQVIDSIANIVEDRLARRLADAERAL